MTRTLRPPLRALLVEGPLIAVFVLAGFWFLMPVAFVLAMRLPAYAFGHEPIGVRLFQAWVPLHDRGNYPFVMVGFLLDLFHRGLVWGLIRLQYDPMNNLVRTMTIFSNLSLLIHAGLMVVISGVVLRNRALPPATRILFIVAGLSFGYVFHWGPLHLFTPDYPLTLIVLSYVFLAFAVTVLGPAGDHDAEWVPSTPSIVWRRGASVGVLNAALLFLKPSLLPYAVLVVVLGAVGLPRRQQWLLAASAVIFTPAVLIALWLLLHSFSIIRAASAVIELARALTHIAPAEPFFRLRDLTTPGTVYFVPFVGFVIWLAIVLNAMLFPEHRRLRLIPGVVLLGTAFYLYVLARRPGNAATFEILVYLVLTGTICVLLQSRSARSAILVAWCVILLGQTAYVARSALPQFIAGAHYTAQVAEEVDGYARSFGLPIIYVYPDHGLALYDVFQSVESSVFKGTLYCTFVPSSCGREYQSHMFALVLKPYQMIGASDGLPMLEKFVLIFADVPEAPEMTQQSPVVRDSLSLARGCRVWRQWRHTIHVCAVSGTPRSMRTPGGIAARTTRVEPAPPSLTELVDWTKSAVMPVRMAPGGSLCL